MTLWENTKEGENASPVHPQHLIVTAALSLSRCDTRFLASLCGMPEGPTLDMLISLQDCGYIRAVEPKENRR